MKELTHSPAGEVTLTNAEFGDLWRAWGEGATGAEIGGYSVVFRVVKGWLTTTRRSLQLALFNVEGFEFSCNAHRIINDHGELMRYMSSIITCGGLHVRNERTKVLNDKLLALMDSGMFAVDNKVGDVEVYTPSTCPHLSFGWYYHDCARYIRIVHNVDKVYVNFAA